MLIAFYVYHLQLSIPPNTFKVRISIWLWQFYESFYDVIDQKLFSLIWLRSCIYHTIKTKYYAIICKYHQLNYLFHVETCRWWLVRWRKNILDYTITNYISLYIEIACVLIESIYFTTSGLIDSIWVGIIIQDV